MKRWALIDNDNQDIVSHILNEIGSNGGEVEILFYSKADAEEYAEAHCLDNVSIKEVTIRYKK